MASDSVELIKTLGGELVTYLPAGQVAKTIKAVIDRRPSQVAVSLGVAYAQNTLEIWIPRDATDGMLTIQERKDRVSFKKSLDDAKETEFMVSKVLEEDAGLVAGDGGMFHLMVTA